MSPPPISLQRVPLSFMTIHRYPSMLDDVAAANFAVYICMLCFYGFSGQKTTGNGKHVCLLNLAVVCKLQFVRFFSFCIHSHTQNSCFACGLYQFRVHVFFTPVQFAKGMFGFLSSDQSPSMFFLESGFFIVRIGTYQS